MAAVSNYDLDLEGCAKEPIHIPGGIQPHGALLVLDPSSLRVLQASTNAGDILGSRIKHGGSEPFDSVGSVVLVSQLREWLGSSDPIFVRTAVVAGRDIQFLGHRASQGIILELEAPPESERDTIEALYPRLGRYVEDLQASSSFTDLCSLAAQQFRAITKFDRVLIYRFDADWNGEVVAEDGNGVLPSYLGLRFPASDIPAQARELYRLNRLRLIPTANYTPAAVEPTLSPLDGKPLDLSFAALRSVSPVHLEYMRNMGTQASMSISVLVEGRLWGLISCHNEQPHRVNAQVRTACDLLGKVVSLQIGAREQSSYASNRIELKRFETDLLAQLAAAETFQQGLAEYPAMWMKLAGATGAAVLTETSLFTAGQTPPAKRIEALTAKLREQNAAEVFATNSLATLWTEFADIADVASGVLAISISQLHPSYILWFRPEVVHTVSWGGDPRKPMHSGAERLHPRNSFAVWKEHVRLKAQDWSRAEIDTIGDFRTAVINFVLRRAEERAALTSQLERSNKELESFSYSVSHDLRAPFRHIVGYTQLLKDTETSLTAKSRHYLDSIDDAATTAGQLVDDLLTFSQLGRTSLAMGWIDMRKMVDEVLRGFEPDIKGRRIEWRIEPLPATWGDGPLLRQALINLIGNAVKYSRDRDPAIIEISSTANDRETVYIVKDNGVGFEMDYVGKLFGVFQRLHRMEDFEGTGIGLALTKRIVERHGGWIRAQGETGVGATFSFAIPKKRTESDRNG